jgi:hypothetical protein
MMNDPAIEACSEGEVGPELAERLSHRIRVGERVDVEDYVRRHPEWAKAIQELMPAIHDLTALGRVLADDPGTSSRSRRSPSDVECPTRAHCGGSPLRGIIPGRRSGYGLIVTAMLAASGCGEGPPPQVNEPPEVARLRAAGKSPREIRAALRASELKQSLNGAAIPGRRPE